LIHAAELDRPDVEWLNTIRPLSLASLKGRLVLLDFWTFCCINCLHVIPLLQKLEEQYAEQLTVIGVHSPKFTHERDIEQVEDAIHRYGVSHPVIHDPERRLWDEYTVRAWPTLVLISQDGYVLGHFPGEPKPGVLEAEIEQSLKARPGVAARMSPGPASSPASASSSGAYRYPAKIKSVPGESLRWALADTGNHQVVLLDATGEEISRYGDVLNGPEGLCCSETTIYVADTRNHLIRAIDLVSGEVSTLAGTGERGHPLGSYWDSGLQTSLASPWDVELVGDRRFFANAGTHQLGELRLADGSVRSAAGNGREGIHDGPNFHAQLAQPSGLAYERDSETLYFVDSETSSVRCLDIKTGWVETLIGLGLFVFGDSTGSFEDARLQHPLGLALCGNELYVADTYNDSIKVLNLRRRSVETLDRGQFVCHDALCTPTSEPAGIACAPGDRLLVVDTNNHRVIEFDLGTQTSVTWSPSSNEFAAGAAGQCQ
jgi:thiol-disulfide isomerase/thioredoxin/sugar lactone lactonase YvrE